MTFSTLSLIVLFFATLAARLLPGRTLRRIALAVINLLMLIYVAGKLAPLALGAMLLVWLLVRGEERLPRWRLVVVVATMLAFMLLPKFNPYLSAEQRLPVLAGASYLAFCLIGLAVDRYRGQVGRVSFFTFWNWASFFPSFSAGPIRRYAPFAAQDEASNRVDLWWSLTRLITGIFKRIVLVSLISPSAAILTDPIGSGYLAWYGMYAYSLKIYLEFSAYTDIALGAAGMLGYRIEENFNWPYFATNISEFWKRWHMSLTGWLRDYLFIPLGGSRRGRLRTALNTIVLMAAIGLWHGLAWNYMVWGLYHAAGLLLYRAYTDRFRGGDRSVREGTWRRLAAGLLTFHFVSFGWVFFACGFKQALYVFRVMFFGG